MPSQTEVLKLLSRADLSLWLVPFFPTLAWMFLYTRGGGGQTTQASQCVSGKDPWEIAFWRTCMVCVPSCSGMEFVNAYIGSHGCIVTATQSRQACTAGAHPAPMCVTSQPHTIHVVSDRH